MTGKTNSKFKIEKKAVAGEKPHPADRVNLKFPWVTLIVSLLLIIGFGAAMYFYNDAQTLRSQNEDSVATSNEESSNRVIAALNTVLFVEEDEKPTTVARVDNPDNLRAANPSFYKNAEEGDYLIVYPGRAVLFRESNNQIINLTPAVLNSSQVEGSDQ